MENTVEKVKVWFRFVPRKGWFPQDIEGLWATRLSADTAMIENVPFLQDGVAEGDVVQFQTDSDGLHWAVGRVSSAGNCTVRVVPVPSGPLARSPQAMHQRLAAFHLGGEVMSADFPMVAFNVPADADYGSVGESRVGRLPEAEDHVGLAAKPALIGVAVGVGRGVRGVGVDQATAITSGPWSSPGRVCARSM